MKTGKYKKNLGTEISSNFFINHFYYKNKINFFFKFINIETENFESKGAEK